MENPGENMDEELFPDTEVSQLILRDIKHHKGIYSDAFQIWTPALHCSKYSVGKLKRMQTYEERIREDAGSAPYADMIIAESDHEMIQRFNAIAALFNDALPRILAEGDFKEANKFGKLAWSMIRTLRGV
jgi:hypothetical protein